MPELNRLSSMGIARDGRESRGELINSRRRRAMIDNSADRVNYADDPDEGNGSKGERESFVGLRSVVCRDSVAI